MASGKINCVKEDSFVGMVMSLPPIPVRTAGKRSLRVGLIR